MLQNRKVHYGPTITSCTKMLLTFWANNQISKHKQVKKTHRTRIQPNITAHTSLYPQIHSSLENKCIKVLKVQAYNILLNPNSSTLQSNIQQLVLHLPLAPLLPPKD
jgi:hypothetical protein